MSWSVSAFGKAPAVRKKIAQDMANIKCSEPEEAIKNAVASAIDSALAAFPPNDAVKIVASGSQSMKDFSRTPPQVVNSLNVTIEPIWTFLE